MKNFIKVSDVVDIVAAGDLSSGDLVAVGNLMGVCVTDIATGVVGPVRVTGEFLLPTAAAQTIAQGDLLNYDASAGVVTKAATGAAGDITGAAVATVAAAAGEAVQCRINSGGGTAS